ncbi:MAG: O-antigen ligase family protein, partial [Gammaproteobacteria bacterium]|nr:O-antigen ligase family protein [Gammaproteobacteria bacterium]
MFSGFGLACFACLLSGARGAWLAVLSGLVLLIIFNPKAWTVRKRAVSTLCSVVLIAATYYALPIVHKRVDIGISQFNAYFSEGAVKQSSAGLRLEVWRAAMISIEDSPWLGIGAGSFNDRITDLVDRGKVDPAIAGLGHVHNEYLIAALHRGIPGLIALLFLLLVPLYAFIKHYHEVRDCDQLLLG